MKKITVQVIINATLNKVWQQLNNPNDIMQWNHASDDWYCPFAENNLRVGGSLKSTMAAKDGSFSFDFEGIYDDIIPNKYIKYHMADNRTVEIELSQQANQVVVTETFDAETENSVELQQQGWQAILNNFKKHVETN